MVVERNNQLLMKNYETRPVGFAPFFEVNVTNYTPRSDKDHGSNHKCNRGMKKTNIIIVISKCIDHVLVAC